VTGDADRIRADARRTLLPVLVRRGVVASGAERILRSGRISDTWFDAAGLAPLYAELAERLARLYTAGGTAAHAVATPDPEERGLAAAVAAALPGAPLPVAVGNGYGLTDAPVVKPPLPAGTATLVVDSVTTRGTRILALADRLDRLGVPVAGVVLVFDREEGLGPRLGSRGIALHALLRSADLRGGGS